MAITLNGTTISSNKLNNQDVELERLNGTTVYELVKNATQWVYISSSSTYDETYSYTYSGGSCRHYSTVLSDLTSARPPSNYEVGYIMRVTHSTYYFDGGDIVPVPCSTFYFRAQ